MPGAPPITQLGGTDVHYSDRFTNHDAIGTPNKGGWRSWFGSDTIVLGNGSATQWCYGLGMSAAEVWFTDFVFTQGQNQAHPQARLIQRDGSRPRRSREA
jgi:hypothetical protein